MSHRPYEFKLYYENRHLYRQCINILQDIFFFVNTSAPALRLISPYNAVSCVSDIILYMYVNDRIYENLNK